MNRFTQRRTDGSWGIKEIQWKDIPDKLTAALYKLKDYEDTGLSPDEIWHMKEDKEWVPGSADSDAETEAAAEKMVIYYEDGSRRIFNKGFFCEMREQGEEIVMNFIPGNVDDDELKHIILGCLEMGKQLGYFNKQETGDGTKQEG